jgi:hypothetical protein
MEARDFFGANGAVATETLRAFEAFVKSQGVVSVSGNVRVHQYVDGKSIVGETSRANFSGAFEVTRKGARSITVGIGRVNGVMPRIGGIYLDGTDADGNPARGGVPALDLEGGDPETRRSYVCIRVESRGVEGRETLGFDPEDEEALTIVHRLTLKTGTGPGYEDDGDGVGYRPVAELAWDARGERLLSLRQILRFDQEYAFKPQEGGPGRHLFSPVV